MAKNPSNNGLKSVIDSWAKAQADSEAAAQAAEDARGKAQGFAKAIYDARGTRPFEVASLGRRYRAFHKPARQSSKDKLIPEQYLVIPLPDPQFGDGDKF